MTSICRLAEAAWDDGTFALALLRHRRPGMARVMAFAAEVAQRPARPIRVTEGPVRLAFAGSDRQLFATLARTFGATGTTAAGRLPWGAAARLPPADVEVVEIGWWEAASARAAGALVLPRWVGLSVDLDEERLDARRRSLWAKAQGRGLTAEVVAATTSIDEFVRRYYEPTARSRHGEEALVLRLRHLRHAARRGELLFVRQGRTRLAGILLVWRNDVVDAWVTGVLDGDYAFADAPARVALYVLAMRHAKQKGARRLGLTSAAPFLGDGLLRFKRAFGARAHSLSSYPTVLRVGVRRATAAVVAALARSPAVHLAGERLVGIALKHGESSLMPTARLTLPGVDGPYVLTGPEEQLPALLAAWAASHPPDHP
ncbi:MAG TPA: GNAT family N-acetyltransferase [Polyangiaceae bacterium]